MNFKMPIPFGARILKTGLAVGITVYLAQLFKIEPVLFAAISTVINIQPSIYMSFDNASKQILSHLLSVVIALAFGYLIGAGPVEMAIVTMLVISLNKKLGMHQYIIMGVVAAIFVLDAPQHQFIYYAIERSYVIFLGLAVALVVNALIAPPKYKDKLIATLKILNEQTATFFAQTVTNFINLEIIDHEQFQASRTEIKHLLNESRTYLRMHAEQTGLKTMQGQDFQTYERYINYNANLYHSSRDIHIATKQRLTWRAERNNPPISAAFQDILKMLTRGLETFHKLNHHLYLVLFMKEQVQTVQINEDFWEELSSYVDQWHVNLAGANFFHALMYVSVVSNDIKLACRGIKLFLNDLAEGGK